MHLLGGFDRDHLAAVGRGESDRTAHENDSGSSRAGLSCESVSHASTRAVGDEPYGVDRFLCGAGGDEDGLGSKIVRSRPSFESALGGFDDLLQVRQPARPDHAACEIAGIRFDDGDAASGKLRHIALCRRVPPHVGVHGGRDDDGAGIGQMHGGEEVVGDAVGELRQDIGGCRSDQQQLASLSHVDVFDRAVFYFRVGLAEQVRDHLAAGERGERERPDEALRRGGHDDLHLVAAVGEQADQLGGLVGGDAAGHAQHDQMLRSRFRGHPGPVVAAVRILRRRSSAAESSRRGASLHVSPRGEAKCVRGASGRGASCLARAGVLDSTLSTASKRNEVMVLVSCASTVAW